MAVSFNVSINEMDIEFLYDTASGSMTIASINEEKRAIICQTKNLKTLDDAKEQAKLLTQNKSNTLFWHSV